MTEGKTAGQGAATLDLGVKLCRVEKIPLILHPQLDPADTHRLGDRIIAGLQNNSCLKKSSPDSLDLRRILRAHQSHAQIRRNFVCLNLNSVLGGGKLNEFTFQYSYFLNNIAAASELPSESFPNGVFIGTSVNVPQTTEQHKYQFRNDFTWTSGRHELKVGASFIYETTLDITFSTGQQPLFVHQADSRTAPISSISYNGSIGGAGGLSGATIPNNQYAFYVQDAWRVTDRLLLDIGVRYDLVTGFAFDQDANILYSELRAAAQAGVFNSSGLPCPCIGFEDVGKEPAED